MVRRVQLTLIVEPSTPEAWKLLMLEHQQTSRTYMEEQVFFLTSKNFYINLGASVRESTNGLKGIWYFTRKLYTLHHVPYHAHIK